MASFFGLFKKKAAQPAHETPQRMECYKGPETFGELQNLIEVAAKDNRPTAPYVRAQIALLQKSLDEFHNQALAEGFSLNDVRVGEIDVRQYAAMKQLAQKIGDPTEKYDELISRTQIRIFGEENARRFFGTNQDHTPRKAETLDL